MSRPSEIYTKTVSVRIPMDSYIELLQDATSMKLSVSELVTMRLFGEITTKERKQTEKQNDSKEWEYVETFSNKEKYSHKHIKGITAIKKGTSKYSPDGKHRIDAIRNGKNEVYKLK